MTNKIWDLSHLPNGAFANSDGHNEHHHHGHHHHGHHSFAGTEAYANASGTAPVASYSFCDTALNEYRVLHASLATATTEGSRITIQNQMAHLLEQMRQHNCQSHMQSGTSHSSFNGDSAFTADSSSLVVNTAYYNWNDTPFQPSQIHNTPFSSGAINAFVVQANNSPAPATTYPCNCSDCQGCGSNSGWCDKCGKTPTPLPKASDSTPTVVPVAVPTAAKPSFLKWILNGDFLKK